MTKEYLHPRRAGLIILVIRVNESGKGEVQVSKLCGRQYSASALCIELEKVGLWVLRIFKIAYGTTVHFIEIQTGSRGLFSLR